MAHKFKNKPNRFSRHENVISKSKTPAYMVRNRQKEKYMNMKIYLKNHPDNREAG